MNNNYSKSTITLIVLLTCLSPWWTMLYKPTENTIQLEEQWNLIAFTVNQTINKHEIKVNNIYWNNTTDILQLVYSWDTNIQRYVIVDTFIPYKGYWIYAYNQSTLTY